MSTTNQHVHPLFAALLSPFAPPAAAPAQPHEAGEAERRIIEADIRRDREKNDPELRYELEMRRAIKDDLKYPDIFTLNTQQR